MAVKTTTEKTEPVRRSYVVPRTMIERFFVIHGSSRPEAAPQDSLSISPSTAHLAEKKCQTAKGTNKGSGKKKKDNCQQEFLAPQKFGASVSIALFGMFMVLPQYALADEFECSIWGRKPNDSTLDDQDVFSSLSENSFNGRNMSYNKICSNAFAYAPVGRIILPFNKVPSLPENLFRGISNLEEVELQGNPFTEVPSVLNSTKTIRYLNLADTDITVIPKHSINGMAGLRALDLSRTEITDVPEDIFDMSLRLVHLSQTKLDRLPLPPPTSVAFNVTLVGTHGTELSISYPESEKRKIGINITGIETLTCENAKTAVESTYCVLAGEIECDHGSFRKINILLKGKTGFPPFCTPKENANTNCTLTSNVVSDVSPNTPVPIWGAATPSSNSYEKTVSLHLVIGGSLVIIGMIIGAIFVGVIVILFRRKLRLSFNRSEDVALQ